MKVFDIALKGMVYLSLLTGMSLFSSCKENAEQEGSVSETDFNLGRNVVEMSAEGGDASVPYFIDNPIEGMDLSVDYEADWLNGFDWSSGEEITFNVEAMGLDDDFREAVVTVSYAEIERTFSVSQTSGEDAFKIELMDARTVSVWVSVEPVDPEMHYWVNVMETEKYSSYASDQDIFEADTEVWRDIAESMGISYGDFLRNQFEYMTYTSPGHMFVASYGFQGNPEYELRPGVSYTVYCYGMDGEGNRLTKIYAVEAVTKEWTLNDPTEYNMFVNVSGSTIYLNIDPSDDNVNYYKEALVYEEGQRPSMEEHLRQTQVQIDASLFMNYSHPEMIGNVELEDLVKAMCPSGQFQGEKTFNYSDMPGFAFVYTVDTEGNIVSQAHTEDFRLDPPSMSDNVITLSISDIGVRDMKWSSETVNQDQYLVYNLKAEDVEGMTDRDIMDSLSKDPRWYYNVHTGSVSMGEVRNLDRNTDYILVAFGYQNAASTTRLFKCEYTTLDEEWADVVCSMNVKYFNGDEVMEKYPQYDGMGLPGQAFVWAELEIEGDYSEYYYRMYNDNTFLNGVSVFDLSDDQVISLFETGNSNTEMQFGQFWSFGDSSIIFAVARDRDGRFGRVYRHEITCTEDGCSPIEELVL